MASNSNSGENKTFGTTHVIITHHGCADGFTAYVCDLLYRRDNPPDYKVIYGTVDPSRTTEGLDRIFQRCATSNLRIECIRAFDVAFMPEDVDYMLRYCSDIKIFDHHKTSKDAFDSIDNSEDYEDIFVYDVDECGASLAWKHYFPDRPIPRFMKYIRIRDLWLFDTPEAKALNAREVDTYLFVMRPSFNDPEGWFPYLEMKPEDEDEFYMQAAVAGVAMSKQKQKQLEIMATNGAIYELNGLLVYAINSCSMQSDLGDYICNLRVPAGSFEGHASYPVKNTNAFLNMPRKSRIPKAPSAPGEQGDYICDYVLVWRYTEETKKYSVSLRSRKGDIDVSVIAKNYGGGGHQAAAGFEVTDITTILPWMQLVPMVNGSVRQTVIDGSATNRPQTYFQRTMDWLYWVTWGYWITPKSRSKSE